MKLIKYQGQIPECIEGLPADAERSDAVKGSKESLHLRPGQTKQLTDDEYAYIKANRPDLDKKIVLLRSE